MTPRDPLSAFVISDAEGAPPAPHQEKYHVEAVRAMLHASLPVGEHNGHCFCTTVDGPLARHADTCPEQIRQLFEKQLADVASPAPPQELSSPLPSRLTALADEIRTCFRVPVQHGGVDHIFADKADEWADSLVELATEIVKASPAPPSETPLRDAMVGLRDRLLVSSNVWRENDSDMLQGARITERACAKEIDKRLAEAASPLPRWQPTQDGLPASGVTVQVAFTSSSGQSRVTRAAYFSAGTLDMDDEQDGDVDEDGKNAEAGWFEDSEMRDPGYWMLDRPVTHWMPLPAAPKEK